MAGQGCSLVRTRRTEWRECRCAARRRNGLVHRRLDCSSVVVSGALAERSATGHNGRVLLLGDAGLEAVG